MTKQADLVEKFRAESDRGAALLAASYLDERLKALLLEHFTSRKVGLELLDGPLAPLGSFSARSKAAFALGLLDAATYRQLNTLRNIRNEFGHNWEEMDFSTTTVEKLCRKLPWLGEPGDEAWTGPRERFDHVVISLLNTLGPATSA